MKIPMSNPDITDAEIEAVNQVLRTPHLTIGPRIEEFEEHFADYIGSRYAIGVSNGTAGLHLSMIAAGVGEGDLVITTPFSFVASSNVILYRKAIPVFVDIDRDTLNIDSNQVAEAVEKLTRAQWSKKSIKWLPRSLRTSLSRPLSLKVILPVHVYGQPADMIPLHVISRLHSLVVIEDACEAVGAKYNERKVGTFGDVAVFAFYPNKQITTGEGSMIVTDREDWNMLFRSLRNQGRDDSNSWLRHSQLGYNYRLDEMSAALGLVQLSRIEELLSKREIVAQWYNERLKDAEDVRIPYIASATTRMSWFIYGVRLASGINRDAAMKKLAEQGIPSRCYFSPIHLQPFYVKRFGFKRGDYPITEEVGNTCLALPFSSVMKEDQVDYVCERLLTTLKAIRNLDFPQK